MNNAPPIERRHNWKEDISRQSQEKRLMRLSLIAALNETSAKINKSTLAEYDSLMAQKREIMALLATL